MNLDKISFVCFLLNLVPFGSLEGNADEKKRSFTAPCFDGGENLSTCSNLDDSCENSSGFKLVRLQGIRVSRILAYSFIKLNRQGNNTIIFVVLSRFFVMSG